MNLHKIFQYLVEDSEFLTIVEHAENALVNNDTLFDIISDVKWLDAGATEEYYDFSELLQKYLSPQYYKYGILPVIEDGNKVVNISFLTSLNLLLRPNLINKDEYVLEPIDKLEAYLLHSITSNCQIDKTKNTCRVRLRNKQLGELFSKGEFTSDVLTRIVNILEINLVIFDAGTNTNRVYWSFGAKSEHINLFRRAYVMHHNKGDYEPIINSEPFDCQHLYASIMSNADAFEFIPNLKLSIHSIPYLMSWKCSSKRLVSIINRFYTPPLINLDEHYDLINP